MTETPGKPFRRSRAILRAAFRTLRAHPRLMWFPILSALGSLVVLALATLLGAVLPFVASAFTDLEVAGLHERGRIVSALVVGFGVQLTTLVGSVALTHATFEAMAGREWTLDQALRRARKRLPTLASFAVLRLWLGRVLRRQRHGKRGAELPKSVLRGAWWAVTYLVVPVLAREERGAFESINRSATLFRQTWKEAFVGRLMLGWFAAPFVVVAALPIVLCAWLGVDDGRVIAVAIGIPVAMAGAAVLFVHTLDTIYRTALYVFATEGVVPEPFDDPALYEIWHVR